MWLDMVKGLETPDLTLAAVPDRPAEVGGTGLHGDDGCPPNWRIAPVSPQDCTLVRLVAEGSEFSVADGQPGIVVPTKGRHPGRPYARAVEPSWDCFLESAGGTTAIPTKCRTRHPSGRAWSPSDPLPPLGEPGRRQQIDGTPRRIRVAVKQWAPNASGLLS